MDKVEYVPVSEFVKPVWIDTFGNYNSMPTPFQPVPAGVFWYSFGQHPITYLDYRQVRKGLHEPFETVRFFWSWDKAFGISIPKKYHVDAYGRLAYTDEPNFYIIGCQHEYEEIADPHNFRGMHTLRCKKCGYSMTYDSSD